METSASAPEPASTPTATSEKENKDDNSKQTQDVAPRSSGSDSSSSDDDDETSLASEFDVESSSDEAVKDPDQVLLRATTVKEEGNNLFKSGDLKKACRSYRKGVRILKPLNEHNTGDEQVKALLVSLYNNLSMLSLKLDKIKMSRDFATQSLLILNVDVNPASPSSPATTGMHDSNTTSNIVKSLYRRAVALKKLGEIELAKNDLRLALKYDANNNTVKKELLQIKKQSEQLKAKQKKGLQKAFSTKKGGTSLYNDKEEELNRKKEEELLKKKQKEKEREQRKKVWEDECVKRMAAGESAISFEDWEKEQEKERKRKKKEEEKRQKEEQRARDEARRRQREAERKHSKDDASYASDDELTEKELAMFRGYKKTSDGRTTSYFTREQSEHEKALIGNIAPQRLEASAGAAATTTINSLGSSPEHHSQQSPTGGDTSSSASGVNKGKPSAWNMAGTWEEKDTTTWCTSQLKSRLKETTVQCKEMLVLVESVEDLTGDASVAIAAGKKKYIFDYHCSLKFEIHDEGDDLVASGKLQIPDICSTHHEELEILFQGWKRKPNSDQLSHATECKQALVNQIRVSVKNWVDDFNNHY